MPLCGNSWPSCSRSNLHYINVKGRAMSKIEILAPVGSEEMLRAAVFSGADAVYLGFSGFNARTGAGNFDADSLKEAVRFCHARGVAVHVALNTTV